MIFKIYRLVVFFFLAVSFLFLTGCLSNTNTKTKNLVEQEKQSIDKVAENTSKSDAVIYTSEFLENKINISQYVDWVFTPEHKIEAVSLHTGNYPAIIFDNSVDYRGDSNDKFGAIVYSDSNMTLWLEKSYYKNCDTSGSNADERLLLVVDGNEMEVLARSLEYTACQYISLNKSDRIKMIEIFSNNSTVNVVFPSGYKAKYSANGFIGAYRHLLVENKFQQQ